MYTDPLWCIIPTYRRDAGLRETLTSLAGQTLRPDVVVVVDNGCSATTELLVGSMRRSLPGVELKYRSLGENTGPAGATAYGMRMALASGADGWILRMDDDRGLPTPSYLEDLVALARDAVSKDERAAGVGLSGSRFNWRSGRLEKPPTDDSGGLVEVDYLATGFFPLFRMLAIREAGTFRDDLFFGFTEVEFGLRLRAAGWNLYRIDKWSSPRTPSRRYTIPRSCDWRLYYSLRNQLVVLLENDRKLTALRVALRQAVGRTLVSLLVAPRLSFGIGSLSFRAIRDALTRRMGMQLDPRHWLDRDERLPPT